MRISFAALSPAQSFLYLLFGCHALPSDIFGDVKCGDIDVSLVDLAGVKLLTDPLLRNRVTHLRRAAKVDAAGAFGVTLAPR